MTEGALAELGTAERQLLRSQRMASLGELAGGVAHDFNNLLLAIRSLGTLVTDELLDAAREDGGERWLPVIADMTEIERATDRAARLTRQLLAFARCDPGSAVVVELNDVVAGMANLLRRTIGADVELVVRLGEDAGRVHADAGELEQVLVNLVVNARDAIWSGGRVVVETDSTGAEARLRVSDTGTGIDPDTMERVFDPYFTTKADGRGTGLGLATVHGIVARAGGRIALESTPGAGTTVTVLLPRTDEPVTASN